MKPLQKLLLFIALLLPLFAHAVGESYTQEKLDALNKAGKPVLVFIYADWCPTCRAQEKVLEKLLGIDEFRGITTLRVDFDAQRKVVRSFGVRYQSTLIVFKNGKEIGRMTGETDSGRIAEFLRSIL